MSATAAEHSAPAIHVTGLDDPYSLPGRYYTDPAIHALEKERIFCRAWNFAGYTSQLRRAGDYVTCQVANENIAVVRGTDDRLRAFYNVCRHRAHQLLDGAGNARQITCPYHAWTYELDGRLRHARGAERVDGFDHAEFCLAPVQVESLCGFVFVNPDPDAAPLAVQAPALAAELGAYEPRCESLTLVHRRHVTIESNWKNLVDNYNENYHTPVVHPVLSRLLDESYRVYPRGPYVTHESGTRAGHTEGFDAAGTGYTRHLNWWLWPNLCLMSFPGGGFRVLHIVPDGPGRSQETYDFYLPYDDPTDEQWTQIRFAVEVINNEDISVCESIQRGQRSRGFARGRVMVDEGLGAWSEHAVLHFKGLVIDALGERA